MVIMSAYCQVVAIPPSPLILVIWLYCCARHISDRRVIGIDKLIKYNKYNLILTCTTLMHIEVSASPNTRYTMDTIITSWF